MPVYKLAKLLPSLLLLGVLAINARLIVSLLDPQPAKDVHSALTPIQPSQKLISARERAEAQGQARFLTGNAETVAVHQKRTTSVSFPSLEQVVQAQVKAGLLLPAAGEKLLAENAARDASIRLRVGYMYQADAGIPFPVITNKEIDQTVCRSEDPAGKTMEALRLTALPLAPSVSSVASGQR